MEKEQILDFTRRISQSNRSGLTVINYEIIFAYLDDAKKAYQEASRYGKAVKIASSEDKTFSYIPDCSDLPISEDAY